MIRTKADVAEHESGGRVYPAVDVKVRGSIGSRVTFPLDLGYCDGEAVVTEPGFTAEWIEEHVPDGDLYDYFAGVLEDGWEALSGLAEETLGAGVRVYSAGRSGGWAVVVGLDPVESWDAVALARWRSFAKAARAVADDVPRAVAENIYANLYPEAAA